MKKILKIILCFIWAIISILCLAFIFIEARLLVAGDWLVYDNALNGFIRHLLRLLIAFYGLSLAVLEFVNCKRKSLRIAIFINVGVMAMIPLAILAFFAATNFVDVIIVGFVFIFNVLKLIINKE